MTKYDIYNKLVIARKWMDELPFKNKRFLSSPLPGRVRALSFNFENELENSFPIGQ